MQRINVGCGDDIQVGYTNIDVRALPGVDVVADIRSLPFDADSLMEIRAVDCLEHIGRKETIPTLKHWHDLLMVGGLLTIQGPCLDLIMKELMAADTFYWLEEGIAKLYGEQDYPENTHKTVFQSKLLLHYLAETGFDVQDTQFKGCNIIVKATRRN